MADKSSGLSADEKAAVKARVRENRLQATREGQAQAFADALAEMPAAERAIADRLDAMVASSAPALHRKTFYGMPAWANGDDKIVCFFQPATKFKARYSTFGFEGAAQLDDGGMWGTGFALVELSPADEKKLAALVARAAG